MTSNSKNELLAEYSYYSNTHQVHVATDASGQDTTFTYTTEGQIATITDAESNVATFNYDSV